LNVRIAPVPFVAGFATNILTKIFLIRGIPDIPKSDPPAYPLDNWTPEIAARHLWSFGSCRCVANLCGHRRTRRLCWQDIRL